MLRLGCHDNPLTARDPATLPPFALLLLVLATRFTEAARAQTLRRRKRVADDCDDVITKPSIFSNLGPTRRTNYLVSEEHSSDCKLFFSSSLYFFYVAFFAMTFFLILRNSICPHFKEDVIFNDDSI